jgi:hypothetical protein
MDGYGTLKLVVAKKKVVAKAFMDSIRKPKAFTDSQKRKAFADSLKAFIGSQKPKGFMASQKASIGGTATSEKHSISKPSSEYDANHHDLDYSDDILALPSTTFKVNDKKGEKLVTWRRKYEYAEEKHGERDSMVTKQEEHGDDYVR